VKIERFEDIKAWQEARVLVKIIYDAIKSNNNFSSDCKSRERIHKAAVAVVSN
jgi:hypothetical protein